MRYLIILLWVVAGLLSSCRDEKREAELEKEINLLKEQLDECVNGEDRIFGQLKNSFEAEDYRLTVNIYQQLIKRFPGTIHKSKADEINDFAQNEIDKEDKLLAHQKAEENRIKMASLTKLKKQHDDITGRTWYEQRYFTHYTNVNRTSIQLGHTKGSPPWLILFMSYTGDDWIFFDKAYLSYDGNTKQIHFDQYRDKKSDNGYDGVWEWLKVNIDDGEVEWYKNFASSPNAKMRLAGKYEKTRNLTKQERDGILEILAGYQYLKENPSH